MSLTVNDAGEWEQHPTAYGMCLLLAEARVPTTALPRKKRLVTVAAVRALWHHLTLPTSRRAVEAGERFADDLGWSEIGRYHLAARRAAERIDRTVRGRKRGTRRPAARSPRAELAWVTARVAVPTDMDPDEGAYISEWLDILHTLNGVWPALGAGSEEEAEAHHAGLIRDVFPNPFRSVTFDLAWRTADAVAVAGEMYESRDFGAMPILADALQDAGCDSADVLDHCRSPGPHVRGCWVVDLVLGKE